MTEKRYMPYYEEVLDTWFGYDGNNEPTEWEIKEKDYLVIGECKTTDDADNVCKRLNELQKENEQLKSDLNYFKAKNGSLENGMFNLEREKGELKTLLKNISDQRNEFHRAMRENANRVGKLENENEILIQGVLMKEEIINDLKDDIKRCNIHCMKLGNENEQLKKELSDFKQQVYGFEDIVDLKNWQQKYEEGDVE